MKIVSLVQGFAANPAVQRAPDALELLQDSVGGALVHEAPLGGEESRARGDLRAGEDLEGVAELVGLELPSLAS